MLQFMRRKFMKTNKYVAFVYSLQQRGKSVHNSFSKLLLCIIFHVMEYSIVYMSKTGNTKLLADTLRSNLSSQKEIYYGTPDDKALDAEIIFVGFWTDKGRASDEIGEFVRKIHGKKVYVFGTAGFGVSQAYFDRILGTVKEDLADDNEYLGGFMCQGKMPMVVREMYEKQAHLNPEKFQPLIDNFDMALSHPDQGDLDKLVEDVRNKIF